MRETPSGRQAAYGVAVLATAVTLAARALLWPVLGDSVPHMVFFPAVMIAAYLGGIRPGLLATLLSAVSAQLLLGIQLPAFQVLSGKNVTALGLFVVVSAILSGLCESLHRAQRHILAQERQRFRVFVDHAIDAFFLQDDQGRILDVNRQACESLGYTREELQGMTPFDFDPDITPALMEDVQRTLGAGQTMAFESRHRRKDGTVFAVEVRGQAFWEGSNRLTVSLVRDITERKRAETSLRESEERFRGTFENAAVGIAHTDPSGCFLRLNERFCSIVGYPRAELLEKTFQDITYPDDLPTSLELFGALLRDESACFGQEKRYRRKDGSLVWAQLFVSLQRDAAGKPAYGIAVIQEISERKRLEGELRRAKEAAEAANRAKGEFLANVSHEIRTPMNAILGLTELALETELTEDQRQCLKTVKSAADSLLGIINDLLDFAKIEAGKLELDAVDFSLRSAAGDTLRALAVRAHSKRLELIYQVEPDVPDALVGDAGRLRQVLLNLVGNAIKFTDEGEVIVRVEVAESEGGDPKSEVGLRFTVRDTGIGIPHDKRERIFEAFEQEDTSTTRRYGGTGLGLTISARLAALMGGQITLESEPGRGSTFTFTARLGLQPHPAEPAPARPAVPLESLPVLVVDDNATNRHILAEWLRGWQMEPEAVGDGVAAMDALWHGIARGRPFALALLDTRMPDTDGLDLAARIRERAELSATRLILLTSGDHPGDLARLRALHVNAHLFKPVRQDELLETISQVLQQEELHKEKADGRREEGRTDHGTQDPQLGTKRSLIPTSLRSPSFRPLRILVAEDNELNAQLLEQLLGRRGHQVEVACNGREALALAEAGGFDLLLLDMHMPELDGFQVARGLRERERAEGGHLPVIALTARARNEDREACLAAGMDDFLAKPVQAADLWAAIERTVQASRSAARPGVGLLAPRVLLSVCGGDAVILHKVCASFQARVPEQVKAVRDALCERNAPRLREAAHKLCGMISAFSTVAGGVASDLEDQAAGGRLDNAPALVGQLEAMAGDLLGVVGELSVEMLREQADGPGGTADR